MFENVAILFQLLLKMKLAARDLYGSFDVRILTE